MAEPLQVNPGDVRSLGDRHAGVAAGLGSLTASAPGAAGVAGSHGTIASAVGSALIGALGSRASSIGAAQSSGAKFSELLHQAALAYERGDRQGGDAIRAAADALERGEGPAGGAATGGGGVDVLGQGAGQLGQLGQLGQQLAAPFAALAQPLQQLPQQIMQGMQGMAQRSSGTDTLGTAPGAADDGANDERLPEHAAPEDIPENAAPETPTGAGIAPMPTAEQRPAPTRPAVD